MAIFHCYVSSPEGRSLDGLMGKSSNMGVLFNTHRIHGAHGAAIYGHMDPINIAQSC